MNKNYRVFNLVHEYGHCLNGCKYAVASPLPEEELRGRYAEELQCYEPFLYITWEMGNAIVTSQSNDSKYKKRKKKEIHYGYLESETERYISEILSVRRPKDPLDELIEKDEERIWLVKVLEWKKDLPAALWSLPKKQRRRLIMYYYEKLPTRAIALRENVSQPRVVQSIQSAEKNLEKFLRLGVIRPRDSSHIDRGAF